MMFLTMHAWSTEMLQSALHDSFGRDGSLGDVGLNLLGIAVGAALSWRRWTKEDS
jgi:hypothetical protein